MKKNKAIILLYLLVYIFLSGCPGNEDKTPENTVPANPDITVTSPFPTLSTTPSPTPDPNVISSYSTKLYDKNEHRINNIKTAAEDLNHTVLAPGEVFSFNGVIGKRTADKGYEKAPILVNGEKSTGTGGGICQVSSTLYNAALEADMEIIERHRHSKKVSYVPEGKDATVVYNSKDFRFRNTRDYPVEILISVSDDEVEVTLYKKTDKDSSKDDKD